MDAQAHTWLDANLATLAATAQRPISAPATADGRVRLQSTDHGPSLSIRTVRGKWVTLHSPRDPHAEAIRHLAQACQGRDPKTVVTIGLGLGHILIALDERAPDARVLALEPEPALARALLEARDWRQWLASGRLTLLWGPEWHGAATAWRAHLDPDDEAPVLVNPVLARECPTPVAEARTIADRIAFGARANLAARRANAPRYLRNTLRNLPAIAREGDVASLAGRFSRVPAVLVAAGPSLDRQLADLSRIAHQALIVAVDTAVRPLADAGIAPHLVVALDPTEGNARHFTHLPDLPHTWLAAEASVDPIAFPHFATRTFVFNVSDHHPWPWLASLGLDRGRLRAWGSVLTSAFDLAIVMGCDPIVFTGADLAYTSGRPYCRGTTAETGWAESVRGGSTLAEIWEADLARRTLVATTDLNGCETRTGLQLIAFRDWLVAEAANCRDRRMVNATPGGILFGRHIERATLGEAMAAEAVDRTEEIRSALTDAWRARAVDGGIQSTAIAAIQHAADALRSDIPSPLWTDWNTFACGHLDRLSIAEALAIAATRLSVPPITAASGEQRQSRPPFGFLLHPPERRSALRSILNGAPPEPWTLDHRRPTGPKDTADCWHEAAAALTHLLSVAGASMRETESGAAALHLPCSELLEGAENVSLTLRAFDAALADACALESLRWARPTGVVTPSAFWAGPIEPIEPPDGPAPEPMSDDPADAEVGKDHLARLALLHEWASALVLRSPEERRDEQAAGSRRLLRLTRALLADALAGGRACRAGSRVSVRDAGPLVTLSLVPGHLAPLMRALTGVLVDGQVPSETSNQPLTRECGIAVDLELDNRRSSGDPRPAFLGPHAAWLEPLVLTDGDVPRCGTTHAFDAHSALITGWDRDHSLRVFDDGRVEPQVAWPRPIRCERPWGAHGGGLAWYWGDHPYAMTRRTADEVPASWDMPFRSTAVYPQPDGTMLWTSLDGGLWSWVPGSEAHRLVDAPPAVCLQAVPGGFRLDPAVMEGSPYPRYKAVTRACIWRPDRPALEELPLGPEAQGYWRAARGVWTAESYPVADFLRLVHAGGRTWRLACYHPLAVAWAGPSLVVTTGLGAVVMFRGLADTLDALAGAPSPQGKVLS